MVGDLQALNSYIKFFTCSLIAYYIVYYHQLIFVLCRSWKHHQSASPGLPWWYPYLLAGSWLCWQSWHHLPPPDGNQQRRRILHDLSWIINQVHMEDRPRVQFPLQVCLPLFLLFFFLFLSSSLSLLPCFPYILFCALGVNLSGYDN